jgi:hypothetical protein
MDNPQEYITPKNRRGRPLKNFFNGHCKEHIDVAISPIIINYEIA